MNDIKTCITEQLPSDINESIKKDSSRRIEEFKAKNSDIWYGLNAEQKNRISNWITKTTEHEYVRYFGITENELKPNDKVFIKGDMPEFRDLIF